MRILLCIFSLTMPFFLFAQGLRNNGGNIVLGSTSYLTINGANGHFVNATSGVDGRVDNNGTITVQGNWTNAATNTVFVTPTLGTVVFSGTTAQAINGTTYFNHLTINNAAGVTLNASTTSYGYVILNAGVFATGNYMNVSLNSGAIAGTGSGSTTGNLRFFKTVWGNKYHYISSPITGRTANDWNDNVPIGSGASSKLYTYDETSVDSNKLVGWTPVVGTGTAIQDMKGYALYFKLYNTVLDVTGAYNHSATFTSPTLTNTPSTTPVFKPASDGWNLMGNPYPTVLDWDAPSGWTKTGLDNAIYFWDPANNRYASYVSGAGTNGGTRYIPSMQGFWVKVTASGGTGSLSMNNNVRTISANPGIYRLASDADVLKIQVDNGGVTDEAIVRFMDHVSPAFDCQSDAYKMMNEGATPSVYTVSMDDHYSVNSLPYALDSAMIPVHVNAPLAGNYTFRIDVSGFNEEEALYFQDLELGIIQELRKNPQYTCQLPIGKQEGRFFISYKKNKVVLSTGVAKDQNNAGIEVLAYQQTISVLFHDMKPTHSDVAVYDASGKLIYEIDDVKVSGGEIEFGLPFVQTGIYIVKVVSNTGNKIQQVYLNK